MAKRVAAGWYPTEDGGKRYWDGDAWTDRFVPGLLPPGTPKGWFDDSSASQRWWNGTDWSPARRAKDGTVDFRHRVGQAVVTGMAPGTPEDALKRLDMALEKYPPCRVVSMSTHEITIGLPGYTIVALVEWAAFQG